MLLASSAHGEGSKATEAPALAEQIGAQQLACPRLYHWKRPHTARWPRCLLLTEVHIELQLQFFLRTFVG